MEKPKVGDVIVVGWQDASPQVGVLLPDEKLLVDGAISRLDSKEQVLANLGPWGKLR